MNESQFDKFIHHYYELRPTDQVVDALEHFLSLSGVDEHSRKAGIYAFARMGQLCPGLVPEYERLFRRRAKDTGWRIVLAILRQTANPQSKIFLKHYLSEASSDEVKAGIADAFDHWSDSIATSLERPVNASGDLDFLWMEFCVTGRSEAVVKIIDVLGRPDRIRARLEDWITSSAHAGLSGRIRRRRLTRKLKGMGIWLDKDSRKLMSTQDLDLYCCRDGFDFSDKTLKKFRSILPFSLSAEDFNQISTKMAAMWSLSSFCYEHPTVLKICDSESGDRSGNCRLTLLEIIGRIALLSNDMGTAVNKLYETLSPFPKERSRYLKECEQQFAALNELSADVSRHCTDVETPGEHITRCVEASRRAISYCSRTYIGQGTDHASYVDGIRLRLEYVQPNRFRVFQAAGKDADEWVTLGHQHYRGPMFEVAVSRKLRENDSRINQLLLVDRYLDVMAQENPASVKYCEAGDEQYYLLEYENIDIGELLTPQRSRKDTVRAQFWIHASDHYLVKVDIVAEDHPQETHEPGRLQARMIHLFAGFGADILVVPPAFQLVGIR